MGTFQCSRGLRKAYPMNTRKLAATRVKKPTAIKIRRSRILHCAGNGLASNSIAGFSVRLLDSLLCSVSKWKVIESYGGGPEAHQVYVSRLRLCLRSVLRRRTTPAGRPGLLVQDRGQSLARERLFHTRHLFRRP